jgi:uncharacterized protein
MNGNKKKEQQKNLSRNKLRSRQATVLIYKYGLFFIGLFVLAYGAATLIQASLGSATWDVLHIGLANKSSLSIGAWVQIVGVLMVLFASILDKKMPQLGSLINILLIGLFLNWILDYHLVPSFETFGQNFILLLAGIGIMGLGSGMYVAAGLGAGPRDGITIVLAKKTGLSIRLVRTLLEGTALLIGWLIGGPVAFGTFVSVFLIGPVMQFSLKFWKKQIQHVQNKVIAPDLRLKKERQKLQA